MRAVAELFDFFADRPHLLIGGVRLHDNQHGLTSGLKVYRYGRVAANVRQFGHIPERGHS
jgi:hypothetical protein